MTDHDSFSDELKEKIFIIKPQRVIHFEPISISLKVTDFFLSHRAVSVLYLSHRNLFFFSLFWLLLLTYAKE